MWIQDKLLHNVSSGIISVQFNKLTPGISVRKPQSTGSHSYEDHVNVIVFVVWNLTCHESTLLDTSMAVFMAGFLVGSFLFGYISDRYGRRRAVLIATLIMTVCNTAIVFSVNFYMFMVLRFFIAVSSVGLMTVTFILLTEVIGKDNKNLLAVVSIGFAVGSYTSAILAYFIREWRHLQGTVSVICSLYILSYWFLFESPKWLISQGRYEDAIKVIIKLCKWQGKEVPYSAMRYEKHERQLETKKSSESSYSPLDLLRTPVIRKRIVLISIVWFIISLVAYGISLNEKNMPGNIYINYICLTSADMLGNIILYWSVRHTRRALTLTFTMILIAVFLFATLAVPLDHPYILTGVMMGGECMVTLTFVMTYVYTSELFPTPLRSTAMGCGSMSARVAGIFAPFLADLINVWHPLPLLIMGGCGFIGGIILLFLPETHNKPLPNTIEEVEQRSRSHTSDINYGSTNS
ncbi:Solute carrier family 22 member 6-B [Nymphon striatum]|nr:Solute carrier family 22 member 6-B [Nymphon striatum]